MNTYTIIFIFSQTINVLKIFYDLNFINYSRFVKISQQRGFFRKWEGFIIHEYLNILCKDNSRIRQYFRNSLNLKIVSHFIK